MRFVVVLTIQSPFDFVRDEDTDDAVSLTGEPNLVEWLEQPLSGRAKNDKVLVELHKLGREIISIVRQDQLIMISPTYLKDRSSRWADIDKFGIALYVNKKLSEEELQMIQAIMKDNQRIFHGFEQVVVACGMGGESDRSGESNSDDSEDDTDGESDSCMPFSQFQGSESDSENRIPDSFNNGQKHHDSGENRLYSRNRSGKEFQSMGFGSGAGSANSNSGSGNDNNEQRYLSASRQPRIDSRWRLSAMSILIFVVSILWYRGNHNLLALLFLTMCLLHIWFYQRDGKAESNNNSIGPDHDSPKPVVQSSSFREATTADSRVDSGSITRIKNIEDASACLEPVLSDAGARVDNFETTAARSTPSNENCTENAGLSSTSWIASHNQNSNGYLFEGNMNFGNNATLGN